MAVTLTYDNTIARVQVDANGLGAAPDAIVERSLDQLNWTTVRGATAVPVVSGAFALPVDDYEFQPNVVNYYRVRTLGATIGFVSAGTAAHADNASVTPGLPAGHAAGQLLLVLAAIRSGGSSFPNVPTDYALLVNGGSVRLFGKIHDGSEAAPLVSFTGGGAGETCSAQMAAFTNATLTVSNAASQFNSSAQNVGFPAFDPQLARQLILWLGQKYTNWTSVNTLPDATEIGEPSSTLGFDQGIVWDYLVQAVYAVRPSGAFVVNGGGGATPSIGVVAAIAPASVTSQTANITPTITSAWLKSIARPFLNQEITIGPMSPEVYAERHGVFPIIGRTFPIAVTDVRLAKSLTIDVITGTPTARDNLRLALAGGDVVFIQTPPDHPLATNSYFAVGEVSVTRPLRRPQCNRDWRVFTLPIVEVAPPAPEIVGATATWQTVLNTYATWSDVLAAHPTWASLLQLVGVPSEVIVP